MDRKLPIGIQGFEKLRTENFLYVDKTDYIYRLVHNNVPYFLSRPRRFGKSLLLSAMKAYWEGKRDLFAGLQIEKLEQDNPDAWKAYPVFYFDFNGKNYQYETALETVLDEQLCEWESIYGGDGSRSLEERFRRLLMTASEKYGKRCVILVDEYDKPLLEVMQNTLLEEHNKAVFKGFFGTLKSCDEYIQFVMITGVTKFSKVSIFSDLNQLNDISLSPAYSGICGITQEELIRSFSPEIDDLAVAQNLSRDESLAALKKTYDGYHFHPSGEGVYNPFSLLKALYDREMNAYWYATGTPTFLVESIKENGFDVRKFTDRTLYADASSLTDYHADNPDLIPLLYQTGYLTILDYDARRKRYTLGFPNDEVKYGFLQSLVPAFTPASVGGTGADIFSLDDCIESEDLDGVKDILKALFASIPYDTKERPFEHYFQTVIYLVFTLLGKYAQCEVHSSHGRADCIVSTGNAVFIFEFKVDHSADEALKQIDDGGYAAPYQADRRKIYKVGVSFDSGTRNLAEWKVLEC